MCRSKSSSASSSVASRGSVIGGRLMMDSTRTCARRASWSWRSSGLRTVEGKAERRSRSLTMPTRRPPASVTGKWRKLFPENRSRTCEQGHLRVEAERVRGHRGGYVHGGLISRSGSRRAVAAREPEQVLLDAVAERAEVIAPLEERQHPAAGQLGRPEGDGAPEPPEEIRGVAEPRHVVEQVAVEAGGDDDRLGAKGAHGGVDPLLQRLERRRVAGPRQQRDVERRALAGAGAGLLGVAGAGEAEGRVLVQAHVEDVRVGLERVLDAVAVVGVEVEDEHPAPPVRPAASGAPR